MHVHISIKEEKENDDKTNLHLFLTPKFKLPKATQTKEK